MVFLIFPCFGIRRESSGVVRILRTLVGHERLYFVSVLGSRLEQEVNLRKPIIIQWFFNIPLFRESSGVGVILRKRVWSYRILIVRVVGSRPEPQEISNKDKLEERLC